MKINIEPIKSWFGFSRRERRSTFILLIIIVLIISIRYAFPESNMKIEDISGTISGIGNTAGNISPNKITQSQKLIFDPNSVSYDTLIQLGLSSKTASTLIKYRNKGGKFKNPSDIKKVYGINEEEAEKLIPFVEVAPDKALKVRIDSYQQKRTLLELNSCDSASLVRLPGIGPVLSSRIIKYRHLLGGFARTDQIKDVYGLPAETYNLIKERVFVDTLVITRIDINSADYKVLSRLPYIEKFEVTAILRYRELKGNISGINELTDNKLIGAEKALKVRPYLKFE